MLEKIRNRGNAYFDTYYMYSPTERKYIGIIEDHCRGVVERYFIGCKFKDNTFLPTAHRPGKTAMFDTYEEALNYIQEEFEK